MHEVLDIEDLIKIMGTKFELEGSLRSFKIRNYTYHGRSFGVEPANSMLFEFPTLQSQFPELYTSSTYKLLLHLGLYQETGFSPSLLNEIGRIHKKDGVDKIVLWSIVDPDDDTIQLLKAMGIDIIHYGLPSHEETTSRPITNFVPIQGKPLEYSLLINHVAEYLVKRLKQLFHLVLSEISASIFDEHYARDKVATRAIMRFEEAQLGKLIRHMVNEKRTGVAVDVGCGTGRHSFMLARFFGQVYAYDFSPKMIEKAEAKKSQLNDTKIMFCVGDFEYERLMDENKFYGEVDLVVASFGMGSFIEDTAKMLRRFYDWLKPGGYLFISFYNENSITFKLTPNWRDTSLSANIDVETQSLKVELPGSIRFNVFCRPFNEGTKGEINKIFNIDDLYMYPTTMALLPNDLLQDKLAYKLFSYVDELLSDSRKLQWRADEHEHASTDNDYGYYVIVVAHKPEVPTDSFARIVAYLEALGDVTWEILEHSPVLSMDDVKREVGRDVDPASMVKTIIFKDGKTEQFISVSLSAEKMVDKELLARVLGVPKRRIKFASEKEVLELGFPVGGVAPFGFKQGSTILKIVDDSLKQLESPWLYMGVGDNTKTLKIARQSFLDRIEGYTWVTL